MQHEANLSSDAKMTSLLETTETPQRLFSKFSNNDAICSKCGIVKMMENPFQIPQSQTSNINPICAKCWVPVMPKC